MFSTIITAAGLPDVSYLNLKPRISKNLFEVSGVPILARAIMSYSSGEPDSTVAVIAKSDEESNNTREIVSSHVMSQKIVSTPKHLNGALVTAIIGASELDLDKPVVIAGGDSEIHNGLDDHVTKFLEREVFGGVVVFRDTDPRWSYIKTGPKLNVLQVSEKSAVGELATTGVFYFKTLRVFLDAAEWCLVNNARTNGEFYVSSALNFLISRGHRVEHSEIPKSWYKNYRFAEDATKESRA